LFYTLAQVRNKWPGTSFTIIQLFRASDHRSTLRLCAVRSEEERQVSLGDAGQVRQPVHLAPQAALRRQPAAGRRLRLPAGLGRLQGRVQDVQRHAQQIPVLAAHARLLPAPEEDLRPEEQDE